MAKKITPPAQDVDETATTYAIVVKSFNTETFTEDDPPKPIIERRQCIVCTLHASGGAEVTLPGQWVHDLTTKEQGDLAAILDKARTAAEAELPAAEGAITETP